MGRKEEGKHLIQASGELPGNVPASRTELQLLKLSLTSTNGNSPCGIQKVVIKSKDKTLLNHSEMPFPAKALEFEVCPLHCWKGILAKIKEALKSHRASTYSSPRGHLGNQEGLKCSCCIITYHLVPGLCPIKSYPKYLPKWNSGKERVCQCRRHK